MPALIAALVAGRAARPRAGAMSGARKTPSAPPATTAAIVPFQLEAITLPFVFVSPMRTPKAVDRHRARRAEDLSVTWRLVFHRTPPFFYRQVWVNLQT